MWAASSNGLHGAETLRFQNPAPKRYPTRMLPVLLAALLCVSARAVPPAFEAARASFLRGCANDGFHEALGDVTAQALTQGPMSSSAILEHFAPLKVRLDEQNKGQTVGWSAR